MLRHQSGSDDADTLYRIARDEAARCDAYARFSLYDDERDQDCRAA